MPGKHQYWKNAGMKEIKLIDNQRSDGTWRDIVTRDLCNVQACDNFMGNLLKHLSYERSLTIVNRLSLIIASLLRIVAPPVADISTVYAINNTLPPTHRPRGCNVLQCACVFTSHAQVARRVTPGVTTAKNSRQVSRNRALRPRMEDI